MQGIWQLAKTLFMWAAILLLIFTMFTLDQMLAGLETLGAGIGNIAEAFQARL